jgi:hypothetical protein
MMPGVFERSILTAAAIATAIVGVTPPALADPQTPGHSPSYQDGYSSEHDFYAIPKNHEYLKSEMQQGGYTAALACQTELKGGPPPASPPDWISGCVDALHDLGLTP